MNKWAIFDEQASWLSDHPLISLNDSNSNLSLGVFNVFSVFFKKYVWT